MTRLSRKAGRQLKELSDACPYTALSRNVMRAVQAQAPPPPPSDLENRLRARMRMGRNIALIGFFCPIFWCSLLGGAQSQTVCLNAVHSGIVMMLGLTLMAHGKFALNRALASNSRLSAKPRSEGLNSTVYENEKSNRNPSL